MFARILLLFIFFFFSFFSLCMANSDSDITALLSFKASLTDSTGDSLSSWVNSSDPCFDSWLGVTCNPSSHRVRKVVLENLNLSGSAQVLSHLHQLRLLSLKNNQLSSSDLNLSWWPHLKHLYLSHNRFSGKFPSGVSNLRRLRRMDLSYNMFDGEIPITELTRLPILLTLRLEGNRFTGTLNSVNSSSQSILDFNVSNNQLSGEIPGWMSRFGASSFAGNKYLCGRPLPSDCSNRTVKPEPPRSRTRSRRKLLVIAIVIFDSVAVLAAVVTFTWCCYKRKRSLEVEGSDGVHTQMGIRRGTRKGKYRGAREGGGDDEEEMVVFEECDKGFRNVGDLLKASAEFLGRGCVGSTFKVVMDGGDVVVVKRITGRKKRRDVDEWLSVIGGLRHSNIVSLRAFYNGKDELLLVYHFLPNGSLHSLLHGNRGPGRIPVDWITRLKLVSDSAKGLAFLHGYNKVKLFHGHLSPYNIVVDHLGNACISDIGVHQILHTPFFLNDAYNAPELELNNNNNNNNFSRRVFGQKCDVYSFGVVLLEILTGKMATDDEEFDIVKWVQRMGLDDKNPWEVFDFELIMDKMMEEEMRALLQVALLCLVPSPKDRPKMSLVYKMIEDIRTKGGSIIDGCTNSIMNNISSDSSPSLSENAFNFPSS